MTTPRLSPDNYARVTAIVTHATLKRAIEMTFPDYPTSDLDALFIDVLDRMARMRGWAIRREWVISEDSE